MLQNMETNLKIRSNAVYKGLCSKTAFGKYRERKRERVGGGNQGAKQRAAETCTQSTRRGVLDVSSFTKFLLAEDLGTRCFAKIIVQQILRVVSTNNSIFY